MHTSADTIRIDTFLSHVFLGATSQERKVAQAIEIQIELEVEMTAARLSDRLADTLDYAALHARIEALIARRSFVLLEHLGETLLTEVVRGQLVSRATIRLRKPAILNGATPEVCIRGRRRTRVAIGLGGNLGDVRATFVAACSALAAIDVDLQVSSLYESPPWGPVSQPNYYNAVIVLQTYLLPHALLAHLQFLERRFGRIPGPRYGPRHLDLDLLVDDGATLSEPELILPHPRLFERTFALVPLAELDPQYAAAAARLLATEPGGLVRLAEWPSWKANLDR